MNEQGQVFTLDMFFALALTALVVSYSGLALEQARRQAEDYALRYSLERRANDAADVLIKTLGVPENWAENAETLETLGFAEENAGNPVPNTLALMRFGEFRRLTNSDNWVAPINASAVDAIRKFFGSDNFEVRILDENDVELWHAFPGWSTGGAGENSGAENSFEVVTVRRLVAVRYGSAIRLDSGPMYRAGGGAQENTLEFEIYPGELDAFDWYIVVVGSGQIVNLKIFVNRTPNGSADYTFVQSDMPQQVYPNPTEPPVGHFSHGGIENDSVVDNQLVEGTNSLGLKFTAQPEGGTVQVYVVYLPSCSSWDDAPLFIESLPATLEVKLWR